MSQLLETIKCKDGKLFNLEFHQARFDQARKIFFKNNDKILLSEAIEITKEFKTGLFRCRIVYTNTINKIEFIAHHLRKVKSLKIVEDNKIDYRFKYSDRKRLNELYKKRNDCDDILILKNGYISDSFTANPVFFDGKEWWTPDTPLLPGTQRARLINENKIFVCRIMRKDLSKYQKVGLINAMWNLEEMPEISIDNIF